MNLRDLMNKLDTLAEADAPVNPWEPKQDTTKQDAWAKLSPEQQKWLGGADPTDPIILARMRSAVPDAPAAAAPTRGLGAPGGQPAAQAAADASSAESAKVKLEKLNALLAALKPAGGQGAAPTGTTTPKPAPKPQKVGQMPMRQQAAVAAGTDPNTVNPQGMAFGGGGLEESMSSQLIESFGYQQADEGIAGTIAGRAAKLLPGVGLAYGAYDAYDRAKEGDYTGAAMAGLSGVASLVPGVGTAVSAGLDAANVARDYKAGKFGSEPAQTATAAPTGTTTKGDPKVYAMQQELIKKGATIKADGIMGPATKAAMQAAGMPAPTVAEDIATLRSRLEGITAKYESQEEQTDEGALSNLWQGAKSIGQNFAGGIGGKMAQGTAKSAEELATSQAAMNAARVAAGKKALSPAQLAQQAKAGIGTMNAASGSAKAANKAGAAIANNPFKAGMAGAAVGGGLGMALGGGAAAGSPTGTTTQSNAGTRPTGSTAAPTATTAPADDAAMAEINQLMSELSQYDIPEIQQGLAAARAKLAAATGDKAIGSADTRTPAEVKASADLNAAGL